MTAQRRRTFFKLHHSTNPFYYNSMFTSRQLISNIRINLLLHIEVKHKNIKSMKCHKEISYGRKSDAQPTTLAPSQHIISLPPPLPPELNRMPAFASAPTILKQPHLGQGPTGMKSHRKSHKNITVCHKPPHTLLPPTQSPPTEPSNHNSMSSRHVKSFSIMRYDLL